MVHLNKNFADSEKGGHTISNVRAPCL